MEWTLEAVSAKIRQLKERGFISVPSDMFRQDEGIVGQLLEREFNVKENNLTVRDLGAFELKGMREKSSTMTLCHKRPEVGLTPIEIFERFGYKAPSKRNPSVLKKKLFTTVKNTPNNRGLWLIGKGKAEIEMYQGEEFICRWDLTEQLKKIEKVILVEARAAGKTGSKEECFHYTGAYLLEELRPLVDLVQEGILVIDFCIDQKVGDSRSPHDRGPHIRIPRKKLERAYRKSIKIV
jgi:hypothetical protein